MVRSAAALLASLLLFAIPLTAFSQDSCTWNGANGDWETACNWSCGLVPGAGDEAVISSGSATLSSPAEVAELTLGPSGSLDGAATRA
jgi:hypothetical protein